MAKCQSPLLAPAFLHGGVYRVPSPREIGERMFGGSAVQRGLSEASNLIQGPFRRRCAVKITGGRAVWRGRLRRTDLRKLRDAGDTFFFLYNTLEIHLLQKFALLCCCSHSS